MIAILALCAVFFIGGILILIDALSEALPLLLVIWFIWLLLR